MRVLGLTGSIAMGKSTAADMLRRRGIAVYDSDAGVHRMLARGGRAVPAIAQRFPGVVRDGAVDRQALGRIVFGDAAALKDLEAIVHPLVRQAQARFLRAHARRRARAVVLDVPLLFEAGRLAAAPAGAASARHDRRKTRRDLGQADARCPKAPARGCRHPDRIEQAADLAQAWPGGAPAAPPTLAAAARSLDTVVIGSRAA